MNKIRIILTVFILSIIIASSSFAQKISPFGMGIYPNRYNPGNLNIVLNQANDIGVKWTRMDMNWPAVEPQKGDFSFKRFDWIVDSVRNHRIKILAILAYPPRWLSYNAPSNDKEIKLFGEYVYKTVKHFKGKIEYWEIWNEPNGGSFWRPKPSVENYTKLLKVSYTQAKKADPNCTILAPGLSQFDLNFIKGIYANGGGKYFDMFSFHPYPSFAWGPPDVNFVWGVESVRAIMRKYGEMKPFWTSEIGYSSRVGGVSENTQADYLVRNYVQSIALNFVNIMWYDFRDDGVDIRHHEMSWGLVNRNFVPKPSYYAYQTMTNELQGMKFEKSLFGNKSQIRGILFNKNNQRKLVLWSIKDITNLSIRVGVNQVTLTNLYGNKNTVKCPDGILKIKLSESPVYISGFSNVPERIGAYIPAIVPKNWLVCDPFISKKDNKLRLDYFKDKGGEASLSPHEGDVVKQDSLPGGSTEWKSLKADKFGIVDLVPAFTPNTDVVAYAYCNIYSEKDRRVIIDVSSDDGNEVWINHTPVQLDIGYRKLREGEHLDMVKLHKGNNSCLIKVENRGGGWGFFFRVLGN